MVIQNWELFDRFINGQVILNTSSPLDEFSQAEFLIECDKLGIHRHGIPLNDETYPCWRCGFDYHNHRQIHYDSIDNYREYYSLLEIEPLSKLFEVPHDVLGDHITPLDPADLLTVIT